MIPESKADPLLTPTRSIPGPGLLSRIMPFVRRTRPINPFVIQFQKIATHAVSAVEELIQGLHGSPEEALARISDIEHQADEAVLEVHRLVDKTFIAPYDKRDIIKLAHRLDRVVDSLRNVARLLVGYRALEARNATALVATATSMCKLSLGAITRLKQVIDEMPGFEHDKVREAVRAIDRIEKECDEILAQSIRELFPDPNQPLTTAMLAWRDIFRLLETSTDYCSHAIADVLSIARQEGK